MIRLNEQLSWRIEELEQVVPTFRDGTSERQGAETGKNEPELSFAASSGGHCRNFRAGGFAN